MPDVSWRIDGGSTLIGELGRAPGRVVPLARAVLEDQARKVADGMRRDIRRGVGKRLRFLPAAVDWEMHGLEAEVGIDKGKRQGPLGNIAAFGTSKNGPLFDHTAALRRQQLAFGVALRRAGEEAAGS